MTNDKQMVYDAVMNEPKTVNQLIGALGFTKNKVYYLLKELQKDGIVTMTSINYRNKVYAVTGKQYAQNSNVQIYLNLRRPSSDYAWQRKKYKAGSGTGSMQSSMSLFESA
jgi:hypothetical protein